MSLFLKKSIIHYIKQAYIFLHIGLVQISLKPLTMEGLNTTIHIALRIVDIQFYKDSIRGLVETTLTNGRTSIFQLFS